MYKNMIEVEIKPTSKATIFKYTYVPWNLEISITSHRA
jgi:hypothetical protein